MVVGGLYSSYPVVADDGSLAGLITLDAVRAEDRARWATTTVGAAATPAADVATVESDASVADVLTVTKGDPRARTIVVADGRPIGIVAPADIARLVTAVELAGPEAFAAR